MEHKPSQKEHSGSLPNEIEHFLAAEYGSIDNYKELEKDCCLYGVLLYFSKYGPPLYLIKDMVGAADNNDPLYNRDEYVRSFKNFLDTIRNQYGYIFMPGSY